MYVKFEKVKILSGWSFQILRLLQIHNYKTFDSSCFLNLKKKKMDLMSLHCSTTALLWMRDRFDTFS